MLAEIESDKATVEVIHSSVYGVSPDSKTVSVISRTFDVAPSNIAYFRIGDSF